MPPGALPAAAERPAEELYTEFVNAGRLVIDGDSAFVHDGAGVRSCTTSACTAG
jgi:hypothetical protein